MSTLEQLEAEVDRLEAELADALHKVFEFKSAACPWKIGDIVETKKGTFKIVRHDNRYGGVTPAGLRQLKSGKWGAAKKLYSWDLEGARRVGREDFA